MAVFVHTAALFLGALLLHLAWWRVRIPRHQRAALLRLCLFALVGYLGLSAAELVPGAPLTRPALAQVALGHVSLTLCYVITYSAIEADSPTLSLMLEVAARGPAGLSQEELERLLRERSILSARLDAMQTDGMLVERDGRFVLPERSFWGFRLILAYRRLFTRSRGG